VGCQIIQNISLFFLILEDKFIKISRNKPVLNPRVFHLENIIMKMYELQHSLDIP